MELDIHYQKEVKKSIDYISIYIFFLTFLIIWVSHGQMSNAITERNLSFSKEMITVEEKLIIYDKCA